MSPDPRLRTMTLRESRGIWQTIANEVAVECFDADGHVDVAKLGEWMTFLGDAETFKKTPLCLFPHAELMRSQMHRICECLASDQNGARDRLDDAADITVGQHGHDILAAMSQDGQLPLNPGAAILASLFTPQRQWDLPTCTIDSLINAEIRNHPERLIEMYKQMLSRSQFHFPSGYPVQQQPIVNGSITVDLKNGWLARNKVFEDIRSGNRTKIDAQIETWRKEEIEYDPAKQYKLKLPVHNMNDVLFTHFFQASYFGNWRISLNPGFGTMWIYAGHNVLDTIRSTPISMVKSNFLAGRFAMITSITLECVAFFVPAVGMCSTIFIILYAISVISFFLKTHKVDESKFLAGIAELKKQAEAQKRLGHRYMHVVTRLSTTVRHEENIDIDALLAFDPNNMEPWRAYPLGDRNWYGWNMSQDIPRLAVRKLDDTPIYEFGILTDSAFEHEDIIDVEIVGTDVKKHGVPFWFSI